MRFSMSRTWSDSLGLVKERWLDLLLVSLSIHVVAALAMLPAIGDWFELMRPGADSEAVAARMFEVMPRLLGLSLLANLLQLVGYGAMVALLGPDRPNLGKALVEALKATPTVFVAIVFLLVGLYAAMFVSLFVVLALVAGTAISAQSAAPGPLAGTMVITLIVAYLGLFAGVLYLMLRFVTLIPVAVIERQYNPFTVLGRSWNLTRANGWRIVAFWVLIWIPLTIVFMAVVLAFLPALVDFSGDVPTVESLVPLWIAIVPLNIALVVFLTAVVVATHTQLTDEAPAAEQA